MLGHTNIQTTQIYARITNEKISKHMRGLSAKFNDSEFQSILSHFPYNTEGQWMQFAPKDLGKLLIHGHTHESRGMSQYQSTPIINPGAVSRGNFAILDLKKQ